MTLRPVARCHWDAKTHACTEHGFVGSKVNCDVQGWTNQSVNGYDSKARHLGTLEHLDHLLLENALFWGNGSSYDCPPSNNSDGNDWDKPACAGKVSWGANESIVAATILPLFARMFAPLGQAPRINTNGASGGSWFHYSEANIAGTIPYPEGIKFVIAAFPDLFGTGPNATEVRLSSHGDARANLHTAVAVFGPP